jgi:hypothetical protein
MVKTAGKYVIALLLWLVSSTLGGVVVVQLYEATRVVAALAIPVDPLQEVMSRKQVLLVSRLALIFLIVAWVTAIVLMLVYYLRTLDAGRRMWRTFLIVVVVQAMILGLATAIVYVLPGLALSGGA